MENEEEKKQYLSDLENGDHQLLRMQTCRAFSKSLNDIGGVLWAFGIIREPYRKALAIAVQMGGALSDGVILSLDNKNLYSAAALLRQFVEVEYLLYLFTGNASEAIEWIEGDQAILRQWFTPAGMRKRSNGVFRDREYWAHCDVGGHPNPKAEYLLPQHFEFRNKKAVAQSPNFLWVDLAQHILRALKILKRPENGLQSIDGVKSHLAEISKTMNLWLEKDPCSSRVPESWVAGTEE